MKSTYQKIPEELRALPNWVVWRLEKRANQRGIVRATTRCLMDRSQGRDSSYDIKDIGANIVGR